MHYSYKDGKNMDGKKCFTLTQNKPAVMNVDDEKVTIDYPSGNSLDIPRSMVEEALHTLQVKGILTVEDVHENITGQQGAITDRLLAVLRELPGTTYSPTPRAIHITKGSENQ
jgi:hypothetical protein